MKPHEIPPQISATFHKILLFFPGVTYFHKILVIREIPDIFWQFPTKLRKISAGGFPDEFVFNIEQVKSKPCKIESSDDQNK
jgi:hypothetical protein